jgi:RNA polymerase sigma-70 factor, ECF subfamily
VSAEADDEPAVLARALAGDQAALADLMERSLPQVRAVLHRLLGARAEVEDLLQEARLRAVRGLAGFRGGATFATWFTRIALNLGLSELRRRRVAAAVPLDPALEVADPAQEEPWVHAQRVELRERLAAAVDRLPDAMREVFHLCCKDGLSSFAAAERLGVPAATVRTRLFHARRRLREALDDLVSG